MEGLQMVATLMTRYCDKWFVDSVEGSDDGHNAGRPADNRLLTIDDTSSSVICPSSTF